MKCYTAIKTLLIGLGVTSLSLGDCMQPTDMVPYSRQAGSNRQPILGATSQNTPIMLDIGASMLSDMTEQDVPVVLHVNNSVQATLMQIAEFAKSGRTDLTELVSKDVLLEAMKQKPRLWGTHLKCLYVGRGLREGDRNTMLAKGLYEYYKKDLKWNHTSEEEILFLVRFLRSAKIKEFEYPAKTPSKENSGYRYYDIVKDVDRVMIWFCIDDSHKRDKNLFFPNDWQDHNVVLILDHEALARVCMLHLSGDVDINEHGQTLVCFGHAGQQIGMVNQVKQQNAELISQAEDRSKQIAEEKERNESLVQQLQGLQDKMREAEEKSASLMQQVEDLRASNEQLSMRLDVTEKQHAEREKIMFSQFIDFINAMIDGVKFADGWINDLCHSSSMEMQFLEGYGLVLAAGVKGIALSDLVAVTKQAREADRRQMSISGQYQPCQDGRVGGTFMQQQPQHSQDITMSIPRQVGPLQDANYPAYQQQTYNSVSVQPQQYGMSAQTQQNHGAYIQQQHQNSQGVTMSVLMPNVAQQGGADHYMSQNPYDYCFPK